MLILVSTDLYRPRSIENAKLEGSAGLNRGTVEVAFDGFPSLEWGQAIPGSAELQTAGNSAVLRYVPTETGRLVVVLWHKGDAGSFHGAGSAVVEPRCSHKPDSVWGHPACGGAALDHPMKALGDKEPHGFVPGPAYAFMRKHDGVRWTAESSSGGGNFAAVVAVLSPGANPLHIKLSGYRGRREWRILTVDPDGHITTVPMNTFLARHELGEAL
jgi:hypothetical protein